MSDINYHPQIEVLSASDGIRRRQWSNEDKLRIVEESFVGHRQVAATARRHGICRSLLMIWRRRYRNGELGVGRPVTFAPVTVTRDDRGTRRMFIRTRLIRETIEQTLKHLDARTETERGSRAQADPFCQNGPPKYAGRSVWR